MLQSSIAHSIIWLDISINISAVLIIFIIFQTHADAHFRTHDALTTVWQTFLLTQFSSQPFIPPPVNWLPTAFLPYLLTYSMEHSPSWEANRFSLSQEIPRKLWNPKVHYRSHKGFLSLFRNIIHFYGEELLGTSPKPQAGGPPLVGCPRLLIQYIRSYPPQREDAPCLCGRDPLITDCLPYVKY